MARFAEVGDDAHPTVTGAPDDLGEQREADRERSVRRDGQLDVRAGLGRQCVDSTVEIVRDRRDVGIVAAEGLEGHDRAQARGRAGANRCAVIGRVDERRHARAEALGRAELRHRVQSRRTQHGCPAGVRGDPGPEREPVAEARVRGVLDVRVQVHEAGREHASGQLDQARLGMRPRKSRGGTHGLDPLALHEYCAARQRR